ncbi:MAG: SH3 domain-containing protein [Synergistaceae bacterium]|nr:SH3 domain-containing protein [Synergistaceae bacterium]
MSWIILALTLGASITSIIHGVFMLFGSLSVTGGAVFGIPSTLLASLPVISAVIALIGGITAFNQSKWGALFLFIAMGLCVPARDTWLYGGLYFFAGLFCFFLKPRQNEQDSLYYDDEYDSQPYAEDSDFYYDPPLPSQEEIPAEDARPVSVAEADDPLVGGNISVSDALQISPEPPKLRRRMSKSCPECGAIVSRENRYCPTCGAKLSVIPDTDNFTLSGRDDDIDIEKLNDQLLTPISVDDDGDDYLEQQPVEDGAMNIDMNDGDEMPNYRVQVNRSSNPSGEETMRRTAKRVSDNEAATSYQEFSRYTSQGKKRKRSTGRRVLSMMLLVAAVGGALYFLLGLRKLPPGDLPPIAKTEVTRETQPLPIAEPEREKDIPPVKTAEPVGIAVAENVLPNFTPDREPRSGIITGSSVNVRADHNTSSSRVTRLKSNTRVEVLGTYNVTSGQYAGIWYNIRTGGNEGWVYGRYLQPLGSGLPAGYSAALLKTFGGTKSQLVESLGNPTRSTGSSAEWPGLTATLKGEDITRIRLTNSSRELQNGLKPGMSQTALQQIMGYPSSQNGRTLNYNENGKTGLTVQLDRNNAISTITVNEI